MSLMTLSCGEFTEKAVKHKQPRQEKLFNLFLEYAGELVNMLKGDASRKELKQALGKAVVEMHQKCDETQKYFLKLANMSGS